jgi:molybdate transport system substrate-binding protein
MKAIKSTRMVNLLTNQLVVIVPKNTSINGSISEVLTNSKLIAIADPKLAPAGKYSKEALTNMGLWESVEAKLVFGGNVKTALAWVNFENTDAGIVYLTDAFKNQNVKIVSPIPNGFHSPITYPIAVLDKSERKDVASNFIDFLQSPQAKKVFEKYGFVVSRQPITK